MEYLTGFDQPKLCAMYVDKKLAGVLGVQALSRLNRSAPKFGKKTEDLFVLDFFNSVDDIKTAFDPFYTSTSLSEATDINVLHEIKDNLDDVGVYEWSEVENFVTRYFNNEDAQSLSPIIDVAAARFNHELELENDDKIDFKVKAKQFVKIYGQMAAIMPYEMVIWEKLFWFLKFLIPKLKVQDPDSELLDELLNSVDLSSYGLERVDEIVNTFNERWFQGWSATPEEQRVKFVSIIDSVKTHPDFDQKVKNNPDPYNRDLAFKKMLREIMLQRRKDEMQLYKLFAGDEAFKSALEDSVKQAVDL